MEKDFLERNLEQSIYLSMPGQPIRNDKKYVVKKDVKATDDIFERVLCLNCNTYIRMDEFDEHSLGHIR